MAHGTQKPPSLRQDIRDDLLSTRSSSVSLNSKWKSVRSLLFLPVCNEKPGQMSRALSGMETLTALLCYLIAETPALSLCLHSRLARFPRAAVLEPMVDFPRSGLTTSSLHRAFMPCLPRGVWVSDCRAAQGRGAGQSRAVMSSPRGRKGGAGATHGHISGAVRAGSGPLREEKA